jgi:hypothetical protein
MRRYWPFDWHLDLKKNDSADACIERKSLYHEASLQDSISIVALPNGLPAIIVWVISALLPFH